MGVSLWGRHWDNLPVLTDTDALQTVLDVCGVFVFGLSGALVAVRKGLDLFGILVLAWIAGLGGGILRDLLLGITPPVGVSDWRLLASAVLAGVLVFLLHGTWQQTVARRPGRPSRIVSHGVRMLDAAGLGLFAVSGSLVALGRHAGALTAVLVGGITAVGGGLLRDLLAGQVPEVLRRELYAVPALAGAAVVVGLDAAGALTTVTAWVAVGLVFATRVLAVALDLNAPRALRGPGGPPRE
jgi:uncharacterized membrane protein YeiH